MNKKKKHFPWGVFKRKLIILHETIVWRVRGEGEVLAPQKKRQLFLQLNFTLC